MPQRQSAKLFAAAFMATAAITVSAFGQEVIKAKLTTVNLTAPEAVLTVPSDGDRLVDGAVMPASMHNMVMVSGTNAGQIAIGKHQFELPPLKSQTISIKSGDKALKLEAIEGTSRFLPVTLPMDGGRTYRLAFPYGYVYNTGILAGGKAPPESWQGMLLYRSGSVQQFMLDGQRVCIYDRNTDDQYRVEDDAMAVGAADDPINVFAPLGKFVATKSGVYQILSLTADGSQIELKPSANATGNMAFALADKDMQAKAIFASEQNGLSVVMGTKEAGRLSLLPGDYKLQGGLVYSSSLKKTVANVTAGTMPPMTVVAGKNIAVDLGGPYKLTFVVDRQSLFVVFKSSSKIAISSSKMHLYGKVGEEYANYKWASEPEVALVAGDKTIPMGKMEFG